MTESTADAVEAAFQMSAESASVAAGLPAAPGAGKPWPDGYVLVTAYELRDGRPVLLHGRFEPSPIGRPAQLDMAGAAFDVVCALAERLTGAKPVVQVRNGPAGTIDMTGSGVTWLSGVQAAP